MRTVLFSQSHNAGANEALGNYVSEKIWGEPGRFDKFCSMAVLDSKGELAAAYIFHNYDPDDAVCEISAAADGRNWMSREVLTAILDVPFRMLGCQCVVARHSEDKAHLRRMWTSLGALEYIIPRVRGRDAPAEVVTVLTDDAWYASRYYKAAA